ncbi:hypothetical protein ACWD7F_35850 [Streptomyces sp. NPDC005122]
MTTPAAGALRRRRDADTPELDEDEATQSQSVTKARSAMVDAGFERKIVKY